jgi:membrane protein DedA with SNARE-associated domain
MEQIAEIFRDWGHLAYPVIFIWTFFEGETVVIFGGYAAHYGILDAYWLFILAWFGSFLGDQTWYYLGRHYGPRLLKRFPRWQPGVFHVSELMQRYGVLFILSFRFIYGVRNVSSLAIGMIHYSRIKFAAINFIAAGLWAASFVGFGFGFAVLSEVVTATLPEHLLGDAVKIAGVTSLALFVLVVTTLVRRQIKRHETAQRDAAERSQCDDD